MTTETPTRRPWATAAALVVTILVTGFNTAYPRIGATLGRTPAAVAGGEWWRLITPIIVNPDGWRQVAFNLTALAVIGAVAEAQWDRRRWLLFYLVGAITGEIAGVAWQPVGAGSSVAVCGLLGSVCTWLIARVATVPARVGGVSVFVGALALCGMHDLHGPPILAGGMTATLVFLSFVAREWRQGARAVPNREKQVEEVLSSSRRYKAVVFEHEGSVMRVEVFRWVDDEPMNPFWVRMSGPSFVERSSLHGMIEEALRCASGEAGA